MIDIHYSDSGDTNNMKFSFITRISIPIPGPHASPTRYPAPVLAFSADGSKFAMGMSRSRVSVWDIQSKVPFKTFIPESDFNDRPVQHLQFSNGNLGKEVLVFVEVCLMFTV